MAHNRRLRVEPLEDRRLLAITVDTHIDVVDPGDGMRSLREAVSEANDSPGPDIIDFAFGVHGETIKLELGEIEITESLSIAHSASIKVVIDAQEQSRIFNITTTNGDFEFGYVDLIHGKTTGDNADDFDATFSGGGIRSLTQGILTFRRTTVLWNSTTGDYAKGGGVYAVGDVEWFGGEADRNSTTGAYAKGGGIYTEGNFRLDTFAGSGVSVTFNSTAGSFASGGGIYAEGSITADRGIVLNNKTYGAHSPGGGAFTEQHFTFQETDVRHNKTYGSDSPGGGIAAEQVTPNNSLFYQGLIQDNLTTSDNSPGGAMYSTGDIEIHIATVSANSTGGNRSSGGALYSAGRTKLISSTLSSNLTSGQESHGAGMFSSEGFSLDHATVTANRATGPGSKAGGTYAGPDSAVTINHSIVGANIAVAGSPDLHLAGGMIDAAYSLIGSNEGSSLQEASVATPDANGNMIGGVAKGLIAPKLLPLVWNGGIGESHLPAADSPAINAGDPSAIGGSGDVPKFDQRGGPYSRVRNGRIDIGAIELRMSVVDMLVDENDGDHSAGDFSLREALSILTTTEDRDVITFDSTLFANGPATLTLTQGELEVIEDAIIYGPSTSSLTISAAGNDPTPEEKLGDGSRVFHVRAVFQPRTLGTTPYLELHNLTLAGGDVTGDGGAIGTSSETSLIPSTGIGLYGCLLYDNFASGDGGAIDGGQGPLIVVNSTLSENRAAGRGGAIFANPFSFSVDGELTRPFQVLHSTIAGNSVGGEGGGIYLNFGGSLISNSIVAGNSSMAINSSDLWYPGSFFNRDTSFRIWHSLIGIGPNFIIDPAPVGSPDEYGNLIGTTTVAINPLLGPLADNGGITQTRALLPGSPALNAGDPDSQVGFNLVPQFDQRNSLHARISGGRIDMGAFEVQFPPGDFDADGDVDGRDFLAWQRNPSVGLLSDWQEQYGSGPLSVVSGDLQESEVITGSLPELALLGPAYTSESADHSPESEIPGLGVIEIERPANRSDRGYEDVLDDDYVEQVDRALEQWDREDKPLGSPTGPSVMSFGEMVARRSVRRLAR